MKILHFSRLLLNIPCFPVNTSPNIAPHFADEFRIPLGEFPQPS